MNLTILCVTAYEPWAAPFLQEMDSLAQTLDADMVEYDGSNAGFLEDALDAAIQECADGYILRLDSDERCTPDMVNWLGERHYEQHEHWAFPRLNFWPDQNSCVMYPDPQTRLSLKRYSGGRVRLHQGSPFGTGHFAPVALEHHKLLLVPVAERRRQALEREARQPGAGNDFLPFIVPEDCPDLVVYPLGIAA